MPGQGPVHLRRATAEDAAGIADVHAERWRATHVGLVPEAYLSCVSARSHVEFWHGELEVSAPGHEPWVALIDDRVVGFASGGLPRDHGAASMTAEVYEFFVDPACWSQGIRSNLMRHLVRDLKARGFSTAEYWVLAADTPTRQFLEYVGWRADGTTRSEDCGGTAVDQVHYRHALS
jgi:GNAT superfamily N-acetyltransferase